MINFFKLLTTLNQIMENLFHFLGAIKNEKN